MEVIILHNKMVVIHQFLVSLLLVVVMVVTMELLVKVQILVDLAVEEVERIIQLEPQFQTITPIDKDILEVLVQM